MRIAMLAPISWRVPPRHYGPWERVTSLLTEGLVRRDVDVTLYATADSISSAPIEAVIERPYEEDPAIDGRVAEALHIAHCFEQAHRFDLVHSHLDFTPLTYSGLVATPLLTTIHGFSSDRILPAYQRYNRQTHYVAISDADRHPSLDYVATIHHGIDTSAFTFREAAGDYLLCLSRIHPDKGVAEAIDLADLAGLPLVIAGIVHDRAYFEAKVQPRIDGHRVRYAGSVGPDERNRLLAGALALVHLVNFEEPFGLSMVEAMACGTPVIATPRGSVPEVVCDGTTGIVVAGAARAAGRIDEVRRLSRRRVRDEAVRRFDVERMVDDYIAVYRRILAS